MIDFIHFIKSAEVPLGLFIISMGCILWLFILLWCAYTQLRKNFAKNIKIDNANIIKINDNFDKLVNFLEENNKKCRNLEVRMTKLDNPPLHKDNEKC